MSLEDPLEGRLINRKYRVLKRLGQGGMGMVYLARVEGPAGFEKLVALKVVHAHIAHEQQVVEMFLSEARLSAQLSHANLAQIYDLGDADGVYYIAMEYVRGRDLRGLLTAMDERDGRVPLPLCVFIVARLCEGLDHAHALRDPGGSPLKLVHRDVSPVNCLLSFAGEVKVIDFGIAKAANVASRTRNGIIRGKLAYMSPEQTLGLPLDNRSDVFALGVILFELLIGDRPFDLYDDKELGIIERIRSGEHPRAAELDPEIPPELDRIVERALAVDRERRYATAGAMQEDLQRFLLTQQIHVGARDLSAFLVEMIGPDAARAGGARPEELAAKSNLKRRQDGTTELRVRVITKPDQHRPPRPTRESAPPTRVGPLPDGPTGEATVATAPSRRAVEWPAGPAVPADQFPTVDVPSSVVQQVRARQQSEADSEDPAQTAPSLGPVPERQAAPQAPTVASATDPYVRPPRRGGVGPVTVSLLLAAALGTGAWFAWRAWASRGSPSAGAPATTAFLSVQATQTSEVFIDGTSIGTTPLVRAAVAPGRRELRVDCAYSWGRVRGVRHPLDLDVDEVADIEHVCSDVPPP